jgi:uncharacterized membrane protein
VDPYVTDWLDLLLRWLHVIAGIVWIGTSFYFVALDSHLRPAEEEEDDLAGEAWEVHGGGFYRVQKLRVAPRVLPEPLYWFKWEAYTTWLSGFALFVVLYYLRADEALIDPAVADLSEAVAVAISVALLAAAWLVYDAACRLLGGREVLLALVVAGLATVAAFGADQLFAPRAAYLQVGAMLGTIMAANVLLVIIPGHWELIRAKEAGREPDPVHGIRGKQRSVHNNYLTLPVVFTMIAGHFPITFGHQHAWLVLVALMAVGAWIRLFFNLRHAGRSRWEIPLTAALAIAAVAVWIRPDAVEPAAAEPVTLQQAQSIVERRCLACHTGSDSISGVPLETPEAMRQRAELIQAQVSSRAMPPGNQTGMTEEERRQLVAWAVGSRP